MSPSNNLYFFILSQSHFFPHPVHRTEKKKKKKKKTHHLKKRAAVQRKESERWPVLPGDTYFVPRGWTEVDTGGRRQRGGAS